MSSDWERERRLQEEEDHRSLQRAAILQQNRQELSDAWYSRECPECAEMVKRKAKACNHCGFAFEDWEEQRKDIEHWEERAKALFPRRRLEAWETKKIEEAEYYFSPEAQAERKRKQEESKEAEEEKQRKQEEAEAERMKRWEDHKNKIRGFVRGVLGFIALCSAWFGLTGSWKEGFELTGPLLCFIVALVCLFLSYNPRVIEPKSPPPHFK